MTVETLLIAVADEITVADVAGGARRLPAERIRQVAYFYKDSNLPEACPVYAADVRAWWMDGGIKLQDFMAHIKKRHTVKQALYFTGISYEKYRHFGDLHPWFIPTIRVYKSLVPMAISDVILEAALGDSKRGIKPNAKIALGAARLYQNVEDEPEFADLDQSATPIPPGGEKRTMIAEEIVDEKGNVVMSHRALSLTKHHDNGNDQG